MREAVLVEMQVDVGDVAYPRNPVVLQACRQHQPGVRVGLALLVERIPDPLDDRTADLRRGQLGRGEPSRRYSTMDTERADTAHPSVDLHLGDGHRAGVSPPGAQLQRVTQHQRIEGTDETRACKRGGRASAQPAVILWTIRYHL